MSLKLNSMLYGLCWNDKGTNKVHIAVLKCVYWSTVAF